MSSALLPFLYAMTSLSSIPDFSTAAEKVRCAIPLVKPHTSCTRDSGRDSFGFPSCGIGGRESSFATVGPMHRARI